ncbi:hypothetical protein BGZ47_010740 [Haplosporangium gracile]|nr:hypothetical protein BGZ47_010740 [Haplosporangium gracile]
MLMKVSPGIQLFIVGKRNLFRRALQRRHWHTQPAIPDLPNSTFAGDWVYDKGEEEVELDNNGLGDDFSDENGPTSAGGGGVLNDDDESQGMDDLEYDDQVHIDYQFSPPYPPDAEADSYGDNNGEDDNEDPEVSGASLPYSFGYKSYSADYDSYIDGGDDCSEDKGDYDGDHISIEQSPGLPSYPPSYLDLEAEDKEAMEPGNEEGPYEADDEELFEPEEDEPFETEEDKPFEPEE